MGGEAVLVVLIRETAHRVQRIRNSKERAGVGAHFSGSLTLGRAYKRKINFEKREIFLILNGARIGSVGEQRDSPKLCARTDDPFYILMKLSIQSKDAT